MNDPLKDTESTIAHARKAMSANEPTPSIIVAFASLEKRRDNLDIQFKQPANAKRKK